MKNGPVDMSSKFQAKNIRPSDKLVHLNPPQIHFSAYVTGGLKKLFTKINSHDASVLPLYEYGRFTDIHGHFVPEKDTLLASRYRVMSKVSSRTRGQSSVQIFAKDEFNSDSLVVIKVLHKSWGHLAYQEIHFLWSLKVADPYKASRVVQLLNFFELDDHFCLVFEPLTPEPLSRIFQGFHKDQLIPSIKKVTLRLLTTLGFLQQQSVIHADLKPENILLKSESDVSSVRVIDFGNAIHNKFKEVALYFKDFELQTLLYRAPEVLFGIPFGTEIDLWSLGCILAELYSGTPLFSGTSKIPIIKEMTRLLGPFPRDVFQKGKFYDDLKGYTNVCEQKNASDVLFKKLGCQDYLFRDFLSGLLRYNPADRLSPLKAAQHPFLASELPIAFLMPSSQNSPVINSCPSREPQLNSEPLEIDQLKPDLLQKVQIIKPVENEDFKTEEVKMSGSFRPTFQKSVSPRGSRRYHSLPDVERKSNTDLKSQRHVKISPFHFSSDRKSSLKVSPKGYASQSRQGSYVFDKLQKSSEKSKRSHSKSLGEMEQMSKDVNLWDEESSSSNDRRLKSLMQEIYEVQAMVEKDLDHRSSDSTDSLELKRRRISDSQISTPKRSRSHWSTSETERVDADKNIGIDEKAWTSPSHRKKRSRSLWSTSETERVDADKNIEMDEKECTILSPRKVRVTEDGQCSSNFSLNNNSFRPYQTDNSVAYRKLGSKIHSCDATEQNVKGYSRESNVCSNSRKFLMEDKPSQSGFSRIHSSKISTSSNPSVGRSRVQLLPSEKLNVRNLQQTLENKGMNVTENETFGNTQPKVHSREGIKQRVVIPNPETEVNNSKEGKEQDSDVETCRHEENLTDRNDVPGTRSPTYRGNKAGNRDRDWSDFYRVKKSVKGNYPKNHAEGKGGQSTPLETDVNIDRVEKNVHAKSPERKLCNVGRKAVPRKRLMFPNVLHKKKKRRSESTITGVGKEQDFGNTPFLQSKEVTRTDLKDPYQFPDQNISHNVKSRTSVVHDMDTFELNFPRNFQHEVEKLGHTNHQDSLSITKPCKLNRQKFSLD